MVRRIITVCIAVLLWCAAGIIPDAVTCDLSGGSLMLTGAETVYAADDSYTTGRFDVDIDISRKHVISYDEKITVNFIEPHHGIYRYIPVQKKFYEVRDISVQGGDYEADYDGTGENSNGTYGNEILKIGDPYNTYTGEKDYRIRYSLVCTKDMDSDKDYLSLDLLPTGWQTAIDSSEITMTLPEKVDWNEVGLYTGEAGERADVLDDTAHFSVEFGDDGKTLRISARDLPQGQGVTLQAELPEGYWQGVSSRRAWTFLGILIPSMLAAFMALLWLMCGKDPDIIKPVEFYPPDDLTPAEVGYIVDGKIDNKDLSSMIIYFASRGYLDIREKKKGSKKYELVKKRDIPDTEPTFAVRLFGGLFPYEDEITAKRKAYSAKQKKGEPVPDEIDDFVYHQTADLDDLPAGFGDAVSVARDELRSMYDSGKRKMFTERSRSARGLGGVICSLILPSAIFIVNYVSYRGLGLFSAFLPLIFVIIGKSLISSSYDKRHSSARVERAGQFIAGIALCVIASLMTISICAVSYTGSSATGAGIGIAATIALAISLFFQVFMWARTKENAAIFGKILGFRNFIATAEHDRLKALSADNPEYYYNIMPYAMVMGMSVAWAKKFENMKVPEPDWYEGAEAADLGRAVWYNNIANSCSNQFVNTAATIPDISSSVDSGGFFTGGGFSGGGFGGGGFSGGGFGGGGGGAW